MATMVIVSAGFERRRRRISLWAGSWEGVNEVVDSVRLELSLAASVMIESGGGRSKRCCQVSEGEWCGCVLWMPPRPSVPSALRVRHG